MAGFYIKLPVEALGQKTTTVTLTADNTAVSVGDTRVIALGSDNTTPANRTFTLSAPTNDGQELAIVFVTGSSTAADLQVAATTVISAAWQPTLGDTLSLIGVGGVWYERCRANN